MKKKSGERERRSKRKRTGVAPEDILGLMKTEDRPLHRREILRLLDLEKEERIPVREILRDLAEGGKVVKIRGNRYGLPEKMSLVVGRVKCHPDGYGFVIPETPGEGDVFLSPRNLRQAMHGDRVVARVESVRRKGKEGRIVRVLERKMQKVVGRFMRGKNDAYLVPDNERILQEIHIPEGETRGARPNQIVVAEMTRYPGERARPEGRVVSILGYPDDPEVEPQIILHKYDLPHRFSSPAAREARAVPPQISTRDREGRVDLSAIPTFTIDGEKARDFDDAVSIERERDGGYRLYVSISDVGHYVREGSALDEEAYLRGTSVYFPDRAVPMFPPELSNEICCLQPGVDRLTVTAELRFGPDGEALGAAFYPSLIRSRERLTYTVVRRMLADRDVELRSRYHSLLPSLEGMIDLSEILRRKRMERGALDFDLPEPEVILNLQGETEEIIRAERNLAHQIIEEFMIAANEAAARFLEESGSVSIYRIHEPPEKEAVAEFRRFVSHLGVRMGKEWGDSPIEFQKVLQKVKGRSEERIIHNILLRSMKWAKYSAQNLGHFGLASKAYTHFTSPIRRYPDLMVHRVLKKVMAGGKVKAPEELWAAKANHLSHRERVAMEAEREILDRYRVRFMKDKTGEEFEGIISGVMAFGFFVELKEVFVEGLVRVAGLHGDDYRYLEKQYCLMGERTRRTFQIGDEVRVRVERVDLDRRQIDFGLMK